MRGATDKTAERERSARRRADPSNDIHLYKSKAWRTARSSFLRQHPLCAECGMRGRKTPAAHVDHIIAVRNGGAFWDSTNWQGLCLPCHSRKTAREDGGFGNAKDSNKLKPGCDVNGLPLDPRHHWGKR